MKKEVTVEERKKLSLEILSVIDEFCKKNRITYFLYWGTLLGAVRHKGFIPWDDDIDIAMPRPDYNRFLNEFKADGYYITSWNNTKKIVTPFIKVNSDKTFGELPNGKLLEYGVAVDIFQIDGYPENYDKILKYRENQKRLFQKFYLRGLSYEMGVHSKSLFKQLCMFILYPFFRSRKWAAIIDKNAEKNDFNSSKYVGTSCTYWHTTKTNVYEKECIGKTIDLDFEDRKFPCPIGYDKVLTETFGPDYMTPPPEDKRTSTHTEVYYWKDQKLNKSI